MGLRLMFSENVRPINCLSGMLVIQANLWVMPLVLVLMQRNG